MDDEEQFEDEMRQLYSDQELFDDELQRLREKKLREMEESLGKGTKPTIVEITDESFLGVVQGNPYVLIDFWAEWCGPCRMVSPIVEELAREFAGKVIVGKCNTDDNPVISRQFAITAIPTLMLFAHGQMVDRIIGAYPKESIRQRMERAFL
jgi:thioredoxin 1